MPMIEPHGIKNSTHSCDRYSLSSTRTRRTRCFKPQTKSKSPAAALNGNEINLNLVLHRHPTATIPPPIVMLAAASTWLRARRSRCVFLLLCSPIIIPFLCATFPLLCAVELCLRLCRRRTKLAEDKAKDERLRRCEEGCSGGGGCAEDEDESTEEMGLLQRYLEDQLLLVRSVYDCGDDQDLYQQIRDYDYDSNTPLLA